MDGSDRCSFDRSFTLPQMAAAANEDESKRVHAGATTRQQCWSSTFPDDLLATIYRMLASPRGRARFAVVCRSWRAAARAAPPISVLPWLLLSPNGLTMNPAYCPEDGTVVRLQGKIVTLAEPLSRFLHGNHVTKVVFSQAPTSSDCILAAMTYNQGLAYSCSVVLCKVACRNGRYTIHLYPSQDLADITFYRGDLYGLCSRGELVKFDIGMNVDGVPMVRARRQLATNHSILGDYTKHSDYKSYIFDLNGKLAMALRTRWSIDLEPFFKVFELVDIHADGQMTRCNKKWTEVTSLGDHALFLGRAFSKAIRVDMVPSFIPASGGLAMKNH
ncbi:uncharacterized protein [Aegilops tauschii subsp. strangulata]|nr:uncharacterized protein LOC109750822 [Aegilops tauschii subsp. strangulata]